MRAAPFEIVEPPSGDSPVLVEVPHASLIIDAESAAWMRAPVEGLARDADLYVDELFRHSPEQGATLLTAQISRYVVDLNRAEDDYDGRAVVGGAATERPRGMIWRLTSAGHPVLSERLPVREYERRCREFYRPYHAAVRRLLDRKRERFGFAVMLCAHSMPTPRNGKIAELVPGTRGRSSADGMWIDLVERCGRASGWSLRHDTPYRGGFGTSHYGQPANNVHAIQLEIARRLYMDERTLAPLEEGFDQVTRFASELVSELVQQAEQLVNLGAAATPQARAANGPHG